LQNGGARGASPFVLRCRGRTAPSGAGSVLAGAPLNVLGNLVFLALFTLPFRFAGGRDTPA